MTDILGALFGPLGGIIAGGAALVIALLFGRWQGGKRAQDGQERKAMQDATERQDRGRQAVRDGRDSGGDPDERLRRNDGRW